MAEQADELEKDAEDKGERLAKFQGELQSCKDFVNKYDGVEQVLEYKFLWKKHLDAVIKACDDLVKTSARNLYESYRELVNMIETRDSSERPLKGRTLEVVYQIRKSLELGLVHAERNTGISYQRWLKRQQMNEKLGIQLSDVKERTFWDKSF